MNGTPTPFRQPAHFSFTTDNLAKARAILRRYPDGREASALVPLLDLAQRQAGNWLPQAAMDYVASFLGIPAVRAYEVATFYTMFHLHPVGRYHIQLCRTTPCWLQGGEAVAEACSKRLGIRAGHVTEDGQFSIEEVECLGACANAPVAQINDDFYEDLSPESIVAIIDALAAGEKPKVGSQTGRKAACPATGATCLKCEGKP